jgi:hypothetical protein
MTEGQSAYERQGESERIRRGFDFLRVFEDVVAEIAVETDFELCEDIRRRVVEKLLNEFKNQPQHNNNQF